jgi:hypothetical protein
MTLDGTSFQVSSTAEAGVVGLDTRLDFVQRGSKVLGRYYGGSIRRGYLVGSLVGGILRFRYAQTEATGHVHGGRSTCHFTPLPGGRLRLHEAFVWETRLGQGTNVFDQVAPCGGAHAT